MISVSQKNLFVKGHFMLKIGFIGLSKRGSHMLKTTLDGKFDVEVTALCDLYEDRVEVAKQVVIEKTGKTPELCTTDPDVFFEQKLDAVLIMTSWEDHIPLAIRAMKKNIRVGLEVGGAYSLHDCFALVDTYEQTGTPIMLLENCCYGKKELSVLKMVREGIFGEVVHCSGGYHHALRDDITDSATILQETAKTILPTK